MLHVGFRGDDNFIYCMCPHCNQVCGFNKNQKSGTYRKCLCCKQPFINPKMMVEQEEIRIQWHFDKDII